MSNMKICLHLCTVHEPVSIPASAAAQERKQGNLEESSQRARETWGPTLERTVAIIMVMTNWMPSTAIPPHYCPLSSIKEKFV
jgi:hypothetical protein